MSSTIDDFFAEDEPAPVTRPRLVPAGETPPTFAPPGHVAPPPGGWAVDESGVWKETRDENGSRFVMVCPRAVHVQRRIVDIDEGAAMLEVCWHDGRGWRSITRPRSAFLDSRKLVALADDGLPVSSVNARGVVEYIGAYAESDEVPLGRVARRCGWTGPDFAGFIFGAECIGEAGGEAVELYAPDLPAPVHAVGSAGTPDGWRQLGPVLADLPIVWLAILASAASPLVSVYSQVGWILDICGYTSRGKTTALNVAASVWGRPGEQGYIMPWTGTATYKERAAAALKHLPVMLDDSKKVPEREREATIGSTLYVHASGIGKGRGTVTGVQRSASWCSWMLSTGEAEITSYAPKDDGARARTIVVRGEPLGADGAARAAAIARIIGPECRAPHYGHAGPAVIRWALARGADAVRARWADLRDHYAGQLAADAGAVAGRLGAAVASLRLAAEAMTDAGFPVPLADGGEYAAVLVALEGARRSGQDADKPRATLAAVWTRAVAARHRFWHSAAADPPPDGWAGAWDASEAWAQVAVRPDVLDRWLTEAAADRGAVIGEWLARGWLLPDGQGRATRNVRIAGLQARCYVFPRAVLEDVAG